MVLSDLCKLSILQPFQPLGYPCRAVEMSTEQEMDHVESCAEEEVDCSLESKSPYRSIDGSCNNPLSPRWGSAGSRFSRIGPKSKQPTFTLRIQNPAQTLLLLGLVKLTLELMGTKIIRNLLYLIALNIQCGC